MQMADAEQIIVIPRNIMIIHPSKVQKVFSLNPQRKSGHHHYT